MVAERSDVISGGLEELGLVAPGLEELAPPSIVVPPDGGGSSGAILRRAGNSSSRSDSSVSSGSSGGVSGGQVGSSELWSQDANHNFIRTADFLIFA